MFGEKIQIGGWFVTGNCPKCGSPIYSHATGDNHDDHDGVPLTVLSCVCVGNNCLSPGTKPKDIKMSIRK